MLIESEWLDVTNVWTGSVPASQCWVVSLETPINIDGQGFQNNISEISLSNSGQTIFKNKVAPLKIPNRCILRRNSRVMSDAEISAQSRSTHEDAKVFSTKCDTLVWMKEYPVWAAPRSWVRCRRASQGHYYYGRPKNFSSRAGNLTQSLTNTEG